MQYNHMTHDNYTYLASGNIILHKSGCPGFPVRLAGEIFMRCLAVAGVRDAILFDPCCGGAHMLTALGILFGERIKAIYASDVSPVSIDLARDNLHLLTPEGIAKRRAQLCELYAAHQKSSHAAAIEDADKMLAALKRPIESTVFQADALADGAFNNADFKAGVVIADVPYGNLTDWIGERQNCVHSLLQGITPVLAEGAAIAICCDKAQKIRLDAIGGAYRRVEKFQCGKRKIEIFRYSRKESA